MVPEDETLDLFGEVAAPPTRAKSDSIAAELDLLALSSVRGVGQASLVALWDTLPHLGVVWEKDQDDLLRLLTEARNPNPREAAERIYRDREDLLDQGRKLQASLRERGISFVPQGDPDYPTAKFRNLVSPPRWLFVEGDISLLRRHSAVGIVGTRKPSQGGYAVAERCAEIVVEQGFSVVSGLADGVDEAAHHTTVELGGSAIAAIGTGIMLDFPATTAGLRRRIAASGGVVISEYLPETRYSRQTFVARNRLIAALAAVVVPIEGAIKSGTAHTVRFAKELGRPVIGAWFGGDLPPANELVVQLKDSGSPFFDLASAKSRQELVEFLHPHATDAVVSAAGKEERLRRVYGTPLRDLWRAFKRRPPDAESIEWVRAAVEALLEQAQQEERDD